uniref:Uncharacterized protein n=1 Tax=Molossus molossus TaxID=27622 RepID=A0A7J8ERV1_MOLMO|nr:hypothetical protein HJG59_008732 [Molossus molossus]
MSIESQTIHTKLYFLILFPLSFFPTSRSPDFLLSLANPYLFSRLSLSQEPVVSLLPTKIGLCFASVFPAHPIHTYIIDCFIYSLTYSFCECIMNIDNDLEYCTLKLPVDNSLPNCFRSIINAEIRSDLSSNPQVPKQFQRE